MRSTPFLRLLFALYCAQAGVFLLFAPWTSTWAQAMLQLPLDRLYFAALGPWLRSAVSALGILHLVWFAHDLDQWLARRWPGAGATS